MMLWYYKTVKHQWNTLDNHECLVELLSICLK